MKKITIDNYYLADETFNGFGFVRFDTGEQRPVQEKDLINFASNITLNEFVPDEIREMIEISKALYMYGYLYWSFLTLAQEQSLKAFEATISKIHEKIFGSNFSSNGSKRPKRLQLSDMIKRLVIADFIPSEKEVQYNAIRELRNFSFHPKMQSQWGLVSYDIIQKIANEINQMFLILKEDRP